MAARISMVKHSSRTTCTASYMSARTIGDLDPLTGTPALSMKASLPCSKGMYEPATIPLSRSSTSIPACCILNNLPADLRGMMRSMSISTSQQFLSRGMPQMTPMIQSCMKAIYDCPKVIMRDSTFFNTRTLSCVLTTDVVTAIALHKRHVHESSENT